MTSKEFEFTLLIDLPFDYDAAERALFDAGCDDAIVGVRYGCLFVDFARIAESLPVAVFAAMEEVAKVGLCVRRIDSCELVNQAEIASRIGYSRQAFAPYVKGDRGPGNFPPPICHIDDDRAPLWKWCEVAQWLYSNQMISQQSLQEAFFLDLMNGMLDIKRQSSRDPDLAKSIGEYVDKFDCGCSSIPKNKEAATS